MTNESRMNWSHQRHLFDPTHAHPVTLIGCGSVGSLVGLSLASLGVGDLTIYDADDVSSHNRPMTLAFRQSDLGRYKVDAVREQALALAALDVKTHQRMYEGEPLKGSVISCVDTMVARACIWKGVKKNGHANIFIDTRIHEHFISIFTIDPNEPKHIELYERFLYPDETTPIQLCGSHGIIYVSMLAASFAVRALTNHWNGHILRPFEQFLLGERATHTRSINMD